MSGAAFGILTIDNVRRMYRLPRTRGTLVHMGIFGFASLQALTEHTPGVRFDAQQFGPVGQAVLWVHQYLSDMPSKEALPTTGIERTIMWGDDCDRLRKLAQRRYSRLARGAMRLEQWLADVHKTFPHITGSVVWIVTAVLSVIIGWLLHGWLGG